MAIKLVIFDMDGLMFDTEAVSYRLWAKKIKEMGYEPSVQVFARSMGGHSAGIEEHYEKLLGRKVSIDEIDGLFRSSHGDFLEILEKEGVGVKEGLLTLLDWLEENGIKKVIGSSSSQSTIRKYLSWTNISPDRFDYIMSGDMAKNLKPDPEIFLTACEKVGIATSEAIVLEDSRNGLYAACAAKIPCIFVPDMLAPDEDIENKAFKIADNLLLVIDILKGIM
ncbi:MAG: HAD family phosphatase [Defluviitaleaceae bacterium]|nr:HAD family phosphatase [Defluviitaleaceae bacterium]